MFILLRQFAMMETVISGLSDVFPYYLRKHKTLFTFVACMIGFLLGIPQVCKVWIRYRRSTVKCSDSNKSHKRKTLIGIKMFVEHKDVLFYPLFYALIKDSYCFNVVGNLNLNCFFFELDLLNLDVWLTKSFGPKFKGARSFKRQATQTVYLKMILPKLWSSTLQILSFLIKFHVEK